MIKLTIEEIRQRIYEKHGDVVILDESTYVHSMKKCRFIDKEHGEFFARPSKVWGGMSHRNRAKSKISKTLSTPLDIVKSKLKEHHGDKVSIVDNEYVNVGTRCTFIDVDYGSWITKPSIVMGGCEHPQRAKYRLYDPEMVMKIVREKHGDQVSIVIETYKGLKKQCKFVDVEYGEWITTPSMVIGGCGHPKRGIEKAKLSMKLWGNKKRHRTNELKGSKLWNSRPEDELHEILCNEFGQENVRRQRWKNNWPIDFYVKSIDTYIQYDSYWHGYKQDGTLRDLNEVKEYKTKQDVEIYKKMLVDIEQNEWFKSQNLCLTRIIGAEFQNSQLCIEKVRNVVR